MKVTGESIFNGLLAAIFAGFLFGSLGFPPAAKSFPLVVTIPGLVLSLWVLLRGLLKPTRGSDEGSVPAEQRHRLYQMLLSFAALIALVVLLGMPIAFAVFGFGFMLLISRRGLGIAIGAGVFGFVLVWGLFGQLMHLSLYGGLFGIFGS